MSGGKIQKAGAAYEAALTDNVTGPANAIIKTIDRLKEAFEGLRDPAADANKELQGIAGSMRTMAQESRRMPQGLKIAEGIKRAGSVIANVGQSIGQSLLHIGNQIRNVGFLATGMAAGIGAAMYSTVRVAGDAMEALSAFNAVFRDSAEDVSRWSTSFGKAIGRSSTQMRQGLVNFRAFFTGLGMATDQADAMSMMMQRLSIDMASFFNISDEEGQRRFLGGLAGQSENLLRFGINVQEASLTNTEYAKSLNLTADQMTQLQKVFARAEIITKAMKDMNAEGDAFRTRFSLQNQIKSLSAAFNDMRVAIGGALAGPAQNIVVGLKSLFSAFSEISLSQVRAVIGTMVTLGSVGGAMVAFGTALAALGPPLIALTTAIGALAPLIAAMVANPIIIAPAAVAGVIAATAAVKGLGAAISGIAEQGDGINQLIGRLSRIGEVAQDALQGISDALKTEQWEEAWAIFKQAGMVVFEELRDGFVKMMLAAMHGVVDSFAEIFAPTPPPEGGATPSWGRRVENFRNRLAGAQLALAIREDARARGVPTDAQIRLDQMRAEAAKAAAKQDKAQSEQEEFMQELEEIGRQQLEGMARQEEALKDQQEEREFEDIPSAPITEMVERIKQQFESVGGFGSQFALNAGSFAPVMGPVQKNTEEMVKEQKVTNTKLERMTDALEESEGLVISFLPFDI